MEKRSLHRNGRDISAPCVPFKLLLMKFSLIAIVLGLVSATPTGAADSVNKLSETRSTLEKWVEARQLISRTRADWQARPRRQRQFH
jgi:hypothetical protein